MESVTIDELKKVIALRDLPYEHLDWILAHSEYAEYEDGEIIIKTGDAMDEMILLLEGRMDFYMNVKGQLVFYLSFENDELSGGVSRAFTLFKNSKSLQEILMRWNSTYCLNFIKNIFMNLNSLILNFIQRLIGYMTERARFFATTQMQQEKVSALGKLAAGIAHEMNNPASAIDQNIRRIG